MTIPANTTKIRAVLNAGWSSEEGKEAITLFDAKYVYKFKSCENETCTTFPKDYNLTSNFNFGQWIAFGYGFGRITDLQIGSDGHLYVYCCYHFIL
jgi:hypothetical protein